MTTWILVVSLACNGWGCGSVQKREFPTEESCYKALEKLQLVSAAKLVGGQSQNQASAYCFPKGENK